MKKLRGEGSKPPKRVRHLIVVSHPSTKGFAHKIAKRYLVQAHDKRHEAEILNLYNPRFKQEFLKFEIPKKMPITKVTEEIQDKIRLADNIVFISPTWWNMPTARIVNFLESNLTSGFAFKYDKNGKRELLKGKTYQVFMTADGPRWFYFLCGIPAKTYFKRGLGFCGVKMKSFRIVGPMRKMDDEKKEKFLNKIVKFI